MSTLKEEPTKLDSYSLFWWKIEHHKPKDMEIKDYVQSLFQEKRFSIYQKDYGLAMKVISMDPKSLSLFNDVGCNSQYMNNVLSNENIDVQSRLELIMKYQDKIGPDGFMIPECLTKNLEVIKVIIEKRPDLFDIFDSNDLKSLNYNFIQYKLLKTLYKQDEVKPEKQTDGFEYYFYLKEEPSNDDVFFNLLKKCGWTPYELSESKKNLSKEEIDGKITYICKTQESNPLGDYNTVVISKTVVVTYQIDSKTYQASFEERQALY